MADNLKMLAQLLIARHLRIALPDVDIRQRLAKTQKDDSYPAQLVERDMHCIAVVGAGASVPLLHRGDELADELEAKFGRDDAELERLRLVNNLEEDAFETRLVALSKSPTAEREIREEISKIYSIRHPTLLGYELLAHLLKHRFLDAIVSFNFDELLDQSLDDELDPAEYVRVVSERDCIMAESNPSASNYVPLYVKLHGTASEPESLRFTPSSYYSIPKSISNIIENLLHSEQCVIINVGSNLGSFDFQRLLRVPINLDVFNLSHSVIPSLVKGKIDKEREDREGRQPHSETWLHDCGQEPDVEDAQQEERCNALLDQLTTEIKEQADATQIVRFRSAQRHRTVARLLGSDWVDKTWANTPERNDQEHMEYCRRRVILELAFTGAKSRGLLSLASIAGDRPARYYDKYLQCGKRASGKCEEWADLCLQAGLVESDKIPDILLSAPTSLRQASAVGLPSSTAGRSRLETQMLQAFDAPKLARHVLGQVRNPDVDGDLEELAKTIHDLQEDSEVEFHMSDDRVCSKAFKRPMTLPGATSLEAYTKLILQDIEQDYRLYVSSETGEWLLRKPFDTLLLERKPEKIRLLLAFDINQRALREKYRSFGISIKCRFIDPWRHNRHMTIVCDTDGNPRRAIYFARRLRAPVITAVHLRSIRDVEQLKTLYNLRWDEAKQEEERE